MAGDRAEERLPSGIDGHEFQAERGPRVAGGRVGRGFGVQREGDDKAGVAEVIYGLFSYPSGVNSASAFWAVCASGLESCARWTTRR